VHIWTRDTSQNFWVQQGTVDSMWQSSSCPAGAQPFKLPLQDGHSFWIVAVDPGLIGCGQNDPTATLCQRSILPGPMPGKSTGPVFLHTVD
jgi:hypothetical protein